METENILIDKSQETIETWAYIEIMGHSKVAGRVSERKIGVAVMLQVDIPKPEEGFSHSELYSPASIFSIKPTTESWCRKFIKMRVDYPILPYIMPERQLTMSNDGGDNNESFFEDEN